MNTPVGGFLMGLFAVVVVAAVVGGLLTGVDWLFPGTFFPLLVAFSLGLLALLVATAP